MAWQQERRGDPPAPWLGEVRDAIKESVQEPRKDEFTLVSTSTRKVIKKKKNWSDPGPDKIANFWWKKADTLHEGVSKSMQAIANKPQDIPWCFTGGKISLIPKPGQSSSENQRPITCLNTIYKWFTSCLLKQINHHLEKNGLVEREQRGREM